MRTFHAILRLLLVATLLVPELGWAYTCTVTPPVVFYGVDGAKYAHVVVTETAANNASECAITGLETFGSAISYRADRTAGTGATINPIVGLTPGFTASSVNQVWLSSTTADFVTFQSSMVFVYYSSTGTLYFRSQPNSVAVDHSISTDILFSYGKP